MFSLISTISRASIRLKGSCSSCFHLLLTLSSFSDSTPLHGSVFPLVTLRITVGKWEALEPTDLLGFGSCLLFHLFFETLYFILGYGQLTMLWQFQIDSKGTQLYIYVHPFCSKLPSCSGCHIILSRVPCAIQQIFGYPFKYSAHFRILHVSPWTSLL